MPNEASTGSLYTSRIRLLEMDYHFRSHISADCQGLVGPAAISQDFITAWRSVNNVQPSSVHSAASSPPLYTFFPTGSALSLTKGKLPGCL